MVIQTLLFSLLIVTIVILYFVGFIPGTGRKLFRDIKFIEELEITSQILNELYEMFEYEVRTESNEFETFKNKAYVQRWIKLGTERKNTLKEYGDIFVLDGGIVDAKKYVDIKMTMHLDNEFGKPVSKHTSILDELRN
jgi:hypothetical protein